MGINGARAGAVIAAALSMLAAARPAAADVVVPAHVSYIDGVSLGRSAGAPMAVDRSGGVHVLSGDHYLIRRPGQTRFTRTTISDPAYEREMFEVATTSGNALDFFNNTCSGVKVFRVAATRRALPDPTKAPVGIPVDCEHQKSWHDWWGIRESGIVSLPHGQDAVLFPDDPSNQAKHTSTVWFGSPGHRFAKTVLPDVGNDLNALITRDPATNEIYVAAITEMQGGYSNVFTLHLFTFDSAHHSWTDTTNVLADGDSALYILLQGLAASHGQVWVTTSTFEQNRSYVGGTITVLHQSADGSWSTPVGLPDDNNAPHYGAALVASPDASAAEIWEVNDTAAGIVRREFTGSGGWGAPTYVRHGSVKVDQIAASWGAAPVVEYTG
jgi:hypothetical protein